MSRDPRRTSTAPKRTSLLPRPSSIAIDPSALIAQHAQLTGVHPITIGPSAVLHPHAKISSAVSVVMLGEGVVVFERARIGGVEEEKSAAVMGAGLGRARERESFGGASARDSMRDSMRAEGVVLGRNVVVETGAVVEASEVGEGSVVEAGAVIGKGAVVGKYCTIAAASIVPPYTILPDFTVVFSGSQTRVDKTLKLRPDILDAKMAVHKKQLDMFKRLIANNIAKWTG